MLNSEKIKPVALAIIKFSLVLVSYLVIQSVSRKFNWICSNFLKAYQVNLKACLVL